MPQTSDFLFNLWFKKQNKTPKHLQVNNKYEEKTRYYYSEVKIGELLKKKKITLAVDINIIKKHTVLI